MHDRCRIAITRIGRKLVLAYMEGEKLYDVLVGPPEGDSPVEVGDIYLGKVQNIVENINAAFVELRRGDPAFLPLSEGVGTEPPLKCQDEIVVQVRKAAVKSKHPVATRYPEIAGRFCVVTTKNREKSISRKITDEQARSRLIEILQDYEAEEYGIILRTGAEAASGEEIRTECGNILRELHDLMEKSRYKTCFSLLRKEIPFYLKYIQGMPPGEGRIVTDEREVYELLVQENIPCVEYYRDDSCSLDHLLGLSSKLKKAMEKRVWLKSGGNLVIEPTEALTVIDVNTGKAIQGKRKQETTFFRINCEAAVEAARQIRIRNISGIILIDFIDMKQKENTQKLLKLLQTELNREKTCATVVDVTRLGLVELTRMKKSRPLWESLQIQEGIDKL